MKTSPLIVDGDLLDYTNQGTVLGLKISNTGYRSFIKENKDSQQRTLDKIKLFENLSIWNKKKHYTSLIRSVIEYPPVPINTLKKQISKHYK